MHVFFIKRPARNQWEPASLTVAALVSRGLKEWPHLFDGWGVKIDFVSDLSEHELRVVS